MKYNSIKIGATCAILIPLLAFVVFFLVKFYDVGYLYALKSPLYQKIFPRAMSLCVYPNLAIFYLFLRVNKMLSVRGVLLGTIVMALLVLVLYLAF